MFLNRDVESSYRGDGAHRVVAGSSRSLLRLRITMFHCKWKKCDCRLQTLLDLRHTTKKSRGFGVYSSTGSGLHVKGKNIITE